MAVLNTEKLIEEIEKRPAIWDVSSEEYSDRFVRRKNWKEIVNIFVEIEDGDVDARTKKELENALMKKWKCIRGCFTRELARQRAMQSGKNPGPRKSEYVHFKQLQFLTNCIRLKSKEDYRERSISTSSESSQEDIKPELAAAKRIKREKIEFNYDFEDDPLQYPSVSNKSMSVKETSDSCEQDEDKMFLMSLLSTLKKVPDNKKLATRIKIMTVLDDAISDGICHT